MNHKKTIYFIVSLVILMSTHIASGMVTIESTGHITPNAPSKKVNWGTIIYAFNSTIQQCLLELGVKWLRIGTGPQASDIISWAKVHNISVFCCLLMKKETNPNFTFSEWEAYVTDNVNKFKNDVFYWEIWNEPAGPAAQYGYQDGTPEHYFDMLKSAYEIIKSIQPSATVIGLGGSIIQGYGYSWTNAFKEFSKQVYDLGGGSYCDAISLHFYPWSDGSDSYSDLVFNKYQKFLDNYTAVWGKPIWVSETGQRSDHYTEEDQANYLIKANDFFLKNPVVAVIWFQLMDGGWVPPGDYSFGLVATGMVQKLAYDSLKTILATSD